MTALPGAGAPAETTIGRVSAMTLIIPIRQTLEPPLVIARGDDGYPVISTGAGPPVRAVENLRAAFGAVAQLVASGKPMALNNAGEILLAGWRESKKCRR